jgi:hypothetical protein
MNLEELLEPRNSLLALRKFLINLFTFLPFKLQQPLEFLVAFFLLDKQLVLLIKKFSTKSYFTQQSLNPGLRISVHVI